MGYPYYCVSCGEKLNDRSETLVSLSWLAFNGNFDDIIEKAPVYITEPELKKIVPETGAEVNYELSLLEFLKVAYNESNYNLLDASKVSSAEEAFDIFRKTFSEAYALKQEKERNDDATDDFGTFDNNQFGQFGMKSSSESEKENKNKWMEKIEVPGFSKELIPQIVENFPSGICKCALRYDNANGGYFYTIQGRTGKAPRMGKAPYCVCPKCKKEVLSNAFKHRHVLVGLLGTQDVGKTCLIAALCSKLRSEGGSLDLPEKEKLPYVSDFLAEYENGYPLEKTRGLAHNLIHPSILRNDILWTFVDIPGEALYDAQGMKLDYASILDDPKIRMSMGCHIYIFCADSMTRDNSGNIINFKEIFEDYLDLSYGYNKSREKHFPILFALIKIDKEPSDYKKGKARDYQYSWNNSYYSKRFRLEYALINQIGKEENNSNLINIGEILSAHYYTPITCSAYGFATLEPEKVDKHKREWKENYLKNNPGTPEEKIPHPLYGNPIPRNLDLIIDWMDRIIGNKPIWEDSDYCSDLSKICRSEFHFDENLSKAIATMFSNPSETDNEWLDSLGRGIITIFKQKYLKAKYQKRNRNE